MKPDSTSPEVTVELVIGGMTCAACASRIERRLNRIDGVEASVNYATERARVTVTNTTDVASLISTIEHTGYEASTPEEVGREQYERSVDLERRLVVAIALGIPVLLVSMVSFLQFDAWQWFTLGLTLPVALWSGFPFHRSMVLNLRNGETTMDTLISIGVLASLAWSVWALFGTSAGDIGMSMTMSFTGGGDHLYFEVASTTVAIVLAGRWFEHRSKRRVGDAVNALLETAGDTVEVRRADGKTQTVEVCALQVDDVFVVAPGNQIATDGIVIEGSSSVDMSMLTGESVPVEIEPGSDVVGTAINGDGVLAVRVTKIGRDTQVAAIARLVMNAQSGTAPVQRIADRVSAVFVPVIVALSVMTTIAWLLFGSSTEDAFSTGVAVLIIACPCALGLATPMALLVGTSRGARAGILISGPHILEQTRTVETLVLDKTGTITTGQMWVSSVTPVDGWSRHDVLYHAAAVEASHQHPIARAIVDAALHDTEVELPLAVDAVNIPGFGVRGAVEGVVVEVCTSADPSPRAETGVDVVVDGIRVGTIFVADRAKPSSANAIAEMKARGIRPLMATGDLRAVAEIIAHEVGIDSEDVYPELSPSEKLSLISDLQAEGQQVAMVGDGVNDAAALAAADLGISMGAGSDVAVHASDLTLMRNDLTSVVDAIELSRRTLRTIKVNLLWAFGYNVSAVPLAMSGRLSPLVAGLAMVLSSVFVVSNSLRLRTAT
ncbi:MAG: heavy metal translocating P-type ATPase [Acidimicrobiaceae bacterium]|nr:heavy metal translocating P-type ATPase [Acidimicrobiaceae bacterium]HBU74883.1 cadmium-translocating P-type ATPase [Acidimicrobiaceae bacterium]